MEGEVKNQKGKTGRKRCKKEETDVVGCQSQLKKQKIKEDPRGSGVDDASSSSGWSSEVIEPAIKSMNFRKKRGTRMKELMKGKRGKDRFWEKYQDYFGGDLDKPEESEDQEDYQASSSGRDEFDSDFDLTDSYIGKRGRKKGTKLRRKRRPITKPADKEDDAPPKPKGKRGRKKKVPLDQPIQQPAQTLLKEGQPNNLENQTNINQVKDPQINIHLQNGNLLNVMDNPQSINLLQANHSQKSYHREMSPELSDSLKKTEKEKEVKLREDEVRMNEKRVDILEEEK